MDRLAVYLNDRHVGVLSSDKQQRLVFQYALEWIASKDVPPLSLSLPLREDAFPDERARPFFTNLLPEARVREAVAKKLGISSRNEFGLLDWVVFNYLIHNADAHAKNLSLLLRPDEIRLAPFYDLLSTGVYEGINPRLAMKIGGENRPKWIRTRHWERMAKEAGIGSALVLRTVKAMAKQIVHAAEEVVSQQPAMWRPAPIVGRIQDIILKHAKHAQTS